jgi:RNA polymerase sigma-70 factor (ECF subfamily)
MPTTAPERPRRFADDDAGNAHLWALVDQIQADPDRAAGPFGELYRLTYPAVYRFIRFRVARSVDAEDLAQDVYVRAERRIGRLRRQAGSPAAWLITIARNLTADWYKSAEKRLTVLAGDIHGRTLEGRTEYDDPTDQTIRDAEEIMSAVALYGALSRLGEDQREALRLRYLLGESVAGAAEEMGKTEGALKALTYRATRAMLRDPVVAELGPAARSRLAA